MTGRGGRGGRADRKAVGGQVGLWEVVLHVSLREVGSHWSGVFKPLTEFSSYESIKET